MYDNLKSKGKLDKHCYQRELELKELRDEDFIASVKKVKFSPKLSLYYILINLPDFDKEKHKDVHDYCNRKYNKPSISFGLNNSEFDGR